MIIKVPIYVEIDKAPQELGYHVGLISRFITYYLQGKRSRLFDIDEQKSLEKTFGSFKIIDASKALETLRTKK